MKTTSLSATNTFLFHGILIGLFLALFPRVAHAQEWKDGKHATIVWINSLYGRNNSGIGLAARYWWIGIGTTVFDFAGDTTEGLPVRPGAIGVSVDFYIAADFTDWFAVYGNAGLVGRLATYRTDAEVLRKYQKHGVGSFGVGVQISLVSHLTLGVGYNWLADIPENEGDATYDAMQSIVMQVGYRL